MICIRFLLPRLLVLAAVLAYGLCPPVQAAALTERDQADITQAEAYLNGITTLKARFLQVSDAGGQAEGTAYLARPGRLLLRYDPPSPLLLLADGSYLIVDDRRDPNPNYIPLSSTPAGILVREHTKLTGGDLKVTKVSHQPGVVTISLISSDDADEGNLTLVFSEHPFQLRQWQVVDAENQTTTVSLFDVQIGMALDKKLFEYRDPRTGLVNIR